MTRPKLIAIVGNVGVGKTTLISALAQRLTDCTIICIDDLREEFNATTKQSEVFVQRELYKLVTECDTNILYECSGTSALFDKVISTFKEDEALIIRLQAPISVLKERLKLRLRAPPFPYNLSIEASLLNIEMLLSIRSYNYDYDTNLMSTEEILKAVLALPELK